jgi:hypothetical protein
VVVEVRAVTEAIVVMAALIFMVIWKELELWRYKGRCWWRSGPKGGRQHNSPLSSFPPFTCYYEATSTTKARKGKVETLNSTLNETRKYSAD